MTGLLLGGQPGQHAGIAEQSLRLQLVQPADDLGDRQRDRYADEPDGAASQHRRYEYGSVDRGGSPDHGEGDHGNLHRACRGGCPERGEPGPEDGLAAVAERHRIAVLPLARVPLGWLRCRLSVSG